MDTSLIPTRPGQICKIISAIPDKEQEDVFIISEDPTPFEDDEEIPAVNLKDLQRNIRQPEKAERIGIRKDQLVVVSEDLTAYIHSRNKEDTL